MLIITPVRALLVMALILGLVLYVLYALRYLVLGVIALIVVLRALRWVQRRWLGKEPAARRPANTASSAHTTMSNTTVIIDITPPSDRNP